MSDERYWPAEWTSHDATWIAWPHNRNTWPERFEPIEPVFERMIRVIAEVEPVHVLGGTSDCYTRAAERLTDIPNVTLHEIATNDAWIRDYGPTFVTDVKQEKLLAVDWQYNAWGGKWPPWDQDAENARCIAKLIGCEVSSSRLTAEGGGLETDGEGTLLTTSSCLMAATRNPQWQREDVENELKLQLGVSKVLWVDGGALAGDDTDSHIDQLVRFTKPGRVLAAVSTTTEDENFDKLENQYRCLQEQVDALNRRLEIVKLPTPPPRFIGGQRVPESYCNFYLANSIVLVPTFGYRRTDDAAIQIIKNEFPNRTLVTVDASDLVWGKGAFHCTTQQQPALANTQPLS